MRPVFRYLGLILTGSRGGYLSTIFSLAVFAVLSLAVLRRASGNLFWKIGGAGIVVAIILEPVGRVFRSARATI